METTLKIGICSDCQRRRLCAAVRVGDEQRELCPRCERAARNQPQAVDLDRWATP
jgi:hypothetical protein